MQEGKGVSSPLTMEIEMNSLIESQEQLAGKTIYVYKPEEGKEDTLYYSVDDSGIYMQKMELGKSYIMFSSPLMVFPRNVELGRAYKDSASGKVYDAAGTLKEEGTAMTEVTIEAIENVNVAAGNFDSCLKVLISQVIQSDKILITVAETIWLAEGIGQVKRQISYRKYGEEDYSYTSQAELQGASLGDRIIGEQN